jgi:Broad-minded protein
MSSVGVSLCPEDLRSLLAELHPTQSLSSRREAVRKLAMVSIGDLLADEFWPDSRNLMECALLDKDIKIANIGLRIYAHSFKSAPPYMAPEIYISFISMISHTFKNGHVYPTSKGLDMKDINIQMKLKQFRLLDQFMCELPSLWFRFSEKTFKE